MGLRSAVSQRLGTDEARRFDALGSEVRRRVLEFLAAGEKTVAQIAKGVHGNPATLRYHLGLLIREGFVEEVRPPGHGERGRPAILYRAAKHGFVPGFPARRFDMLALAALQTLVEAVGEQEASRRLVRQGSQIGGAIIRRTGEAQDVPRWDARSFELHILRGLFQEYGMSCEVLARGPRTIEYRSFTCPFLELAEQKPGLVCDALDTGFHDGIDRAVGATTERRRCMGHGDPHCEYRMTWAARATRKPREVRP